MKTQRKKFHKRFIFRFLRGFLSFSPKIPVMVSLVFAENPVTVSPELSVYLPGNPYYDAGGNLYAVSRQKNQHKDDQRRYGNQKLCSVIFKK